MSENNESGNRWEAAVPPVAEPDHPVVEPDRPVVEPAETSEAAPPTDAPRTSKLPGWVTKRGLVATGTAAAFFLGGGGVGYAIGSSGHDDSSRFPARFDRGSDGQMPGGQFPGGPGPNGGQGPQTQSQGQSQGQSQDNGSGSSSS